MKKLVCILLILGTYSSCNKEKQTFTDLNLQNTTTHKIELIPYKNGVEYNVGKITLNASTELKVTTYFSRGISNIPIVFPDYLDATDSIHVIFDATYSITHYLKAPIKFSSKFYSPSSSRNLGNINNYQQTILSDSKNTRNWLLKYVFTEQDYLDAK